MGSLRSPVCSGWELLLCLDTGILQDGVKIQGVESRKLVMTGLGEGFSYNFKEMLKN